MSDIKVLKKQLKHIKIYRSDKGKENAIKFLISVLLNYKSGK